MHTIQLRCSAAGIWSPLPTGWDPAIAANAQLALVFGGGRQLADACVIGAVRERFPAAAVVACSGDAIASDADISDGLVVTAISFEHSTVEAVSSELLAPSDSEAVGYALVGQLAPRGLRHVLVFAEGLHLNGSALARGIAAALPEGVSVSGGLAGDGEAFGQTLVGLDGPALERQVVLVGLYGQRLEIGLGSFGGWEPFGLNRTITRSEGNVLYELNGQSALELYKELLGPLGYALPASGLLFPLKIRRDVNSPGVIRTMLGIDEAAGGLVFAGDVPQGWTARLARTDLDALIAASRTAAMETTRTTSPGRARLTLAISCIGRKLLLQRRTEEELVAAHDVVGRGSALAGFYSYGELAPSGATQRFGLHNQTMTLTTLGEA